MDVRLPLNLSTLEMPESLVDLEAHFRVFSLWAPAVAIFAALALMSDFGDHLFNLTLRIGKLLGEFCRGSLSQNMALSARASKRQTAFSSLTHATYSSSCIPNDNTPFKDTVQRISFAKQLAREEEEEEEEEPQFHNLVAFCRLAVAALILAICAEFIADKISAATSHHGVFSKSTRIILLPIVSNAAEHATAVTVAFKDKMVPLIAVAIGCSMQISILLLRGFGKLGWTRDGRWKVHSLYGLPTLIVLASILWKLSARSSVQSAINGTRGRKFRCLMRRGTTGGVAFQRQSLLLDDDGRATRECVWSSKLLDGSWFGWTSPLKAL